jgi:hypothetical protein
MVDLVALPPGHLLNPLRPGLPGRVKFACLLGAVSAWLGILDRDGSRVPCGMKGFKGLRRTPIWKGDAMESFYKTGKKRATALFSLSKILQ